MKKIKRIERLALREEKTVIRRIVILTGISLFLIFILFTAGIPFLGKFADLLDSVFKGKQDKNSSSSSTLQPPFIDELPQATNSAKLAISGFSQEGDKVEIYLDSKKVGDSNLQGGKFYYEDLHLVEGKNAISAKSVTNSGVSSDFSQTFNILLDTTPPSLEISSPIDGQSFSGNNRIKVEGKTEKNAQIFANGFLANVDSEGKFDVYIPLVNGDNDIEVKAIDESGNSKSVKLKVHYSK